MAESGADSQNGADSQPAATMLAAAGIVVTEEGKARARAKLAEADARWTPELHAQARQQLGLPPRTA